MKTTASSKLTKTQQRVVDWCSGWFTLERTAVDLAGWIELKLGMSRSQAERYALWMEQYRRDTEVSK